MITRCIFIKADPPEFSQSHIKWITEALARQYAMQYAMKGECYLLNKFLINLLKL